MRAATLPGSELELELLQSHIAQKPVLRGEVGRACVAREFSCDMDVPRLGCRDQQIALDWTRQKVEQQHNNNTPAPYVLEVRRAFAQLLLVNRAGRELRERERGQFVDRGAAATLVIELHQNQKIALADRTEK